MTFGEHLGIVTDEFGCFPVLFQKCLVIRGERTFFAQSARFGERPDWMFEDDTWEPALKGDVWYLVEELPKYAEQWKELKDIQKPTEIVYYKRSLYGCYEQQTDKTEESNSD